MRSALEEDEAKRAWLAKLDVPTWGAAAGHDRDPGAVDDRGPGEEGLPAALDAPVWGKAAKTLTNFAIDAAALRQMEEDCTAGDDVACDSISMEEEAKRAWLKKLDAPLWGTAAAAVSQVAKGVVTPTGVVKMSEEEAKRAWLDRLDVPSWGRAAESLTNVVAEAAALQAMEADCQNQIDTACDQLSFEDAARRAWLSKLDVPTWGATAAAVTQVAAGMAPSAPAQPVSEERPRPPGSPSSTRRCGARPRRPSTSWRLRPPWCASCRTTATRATRRRATPSTWRRAPKGLARQAGRPGVGRRRRRRERHRERPASQPVGGRGEGRLARQARRRDLGQRGGRPLVGCRRGVPAQPPRG